MNLQDTTPDLTRLSQSISCESFDPLLKKAIAGDCQQQKNNAGRQRITPSLYIKAKYSTIFELSAKENKFHANDS